MAGELPFYDEASFERRLAAAFHEPLPPGTVARLHRHYQELRRWNPRLSLIGPGTRDAIFERHYAESLAALALIDPEDRRLLDLGSGAGFPGLAIAAARTELQVTLVEARERKWAFLQAALRQAGMSGSGAPRVVLGRIEAGNDVMERLVSTAGEFDLLTSRAVALDAALLSAIRLKSPRMRILLWETGQRQPAPGWRIGRELRLAGAEARRIVEYRPVEDVRAEDVRAEGS